MTRRGAAILVVAFAVGCTREPSPPPNVLLYVVDTLRADSLGAYGNRTITTPAIDRFAREGVVFENAVAQSSWTRPSIASMLTGLHPAVHGAENRDEPVAASVPLLAERFRERGYATAAFTTNPNVGSFYGFARGFDEFYELYERTAPGFVRSTELVTTSDVVTQQVSDWIDRANKPFFLFVLTIDPHAPYTPPAEFDRYGDPQVAVSAEDFDRSRKEPIGEHAMARIRSLYAGEVSFNDRSFGALLTHLERKKLTETTVVALTSDHGEEFWEHGRRGHGHELFEESIRVPLIIRGPARVTAGRRIAAPVAASVDLAPTLLELAGIPPTSGMNGRSLFAESAPDPVIHSRLRLGERELEAVRRFPWKLVLDIGAGRGSLFDLSHDPSERADVSMREKAVGAELAADLDRRLAVSDERRRALLGGDRPAGVSATALPEKAREALKALGYVN